MITSDWHIHTHNSCDCKTIGSTDEQLIAGITSAGVTDFGFSEHIHTWVNYADELRGARTEFDAALAAHPELRGHMHFGVEVSVMSEWEVDMIQNHRVRVEDVKYNTFTYGLRWADGPADTTPTMTIDDHVIEEYGIEYVIAGVHWGLYCYDSEKAVWDNYHRQYLTAIANPHTDILAHWLWWWNDAPTRNLFYDFDNIPRSIRDDIAYALKIYNTAFELNTGMIYPKNKEVKEGFAYKYLEYAASLQDMGVKLTFGSDNHTKYAKNLEWQDRLMRDVGIDPSKFLVF